MPRLPIQARRGFYVRPNRNLTTSIPYDWNSVDTELGLMVEPRTLIFPVDGKIVDQDIADSAFDTVTQLDAGDAGSFYVNYGTGGQLSLGSFVY